MPYQETAFRRQKALLWPKTGTDRYGQPTQGPAQEIEVRWNNNLKSTLDRDGNEIAVDAVAIVAQDITEGSIMWLGHSIWAYAEWFGISGTGSGSGSVGTATELMEVVSFRKVKDLKGRAIKRTVGLARYKDQLND